MSQYLPPNHPVQRLIFFVAQDIDESTRIAFGTLVGNLGHLREWVIGPPRNIADQNDPSLVGGGVEIYSAQPPNELSKEIDRRHYQEVEAIVGALARFSYEHMLAIEFELDGEFVGALEDGKMDRSLEEGLLGEWKRHLDTN